MSGRYAFSLPEPRQRDGWFRIGSFDVTTTILIVLIGVASMFVYAIDRSIVVHGVFFPELVRQGEVWRLVTWPLVNPPDIWTAIDLAIFWWVGHMVEDQIGRKPHTVLLAAMTVLPALVVTGIGAANGVDPSRWTTGTASVELLALALFVVFALDRPSARFFFGIPAWAIAAVIVGVRVLAIISYRGWADLFMLLGIIAVAMFGVRQRGLLDEFGWIPRLRSLSGPAPSPYGEVGSARPRPKRSRGKRARGGGGAVVAGPWQPTGGPTPLEQAELDVLLDRISEGGIDSLTPFEKERLNELSRRMRDS